MRRYPAIKTRFSPLLPLILILGAFLLGTGSLYGRPGFGNHDAAAVALALPAQPAASQNIALNAGWNVISSYITPADPLLDTLFLGINNELVLVKNGNGQVYWPDMNTDNIVSWQVNEGYQVLMNAAAVLSISGTQITPAAVIPDLPPGWNLIANQYSTSRPIADALAGYGSDLQVAKNGAGQIYWPIYHIDQISTLEPGQGYWINLAAGTIPQNQAPIIKSGTLAFSKKILATDVWGTHAVAAADLDLDGDLDAASTNYVSGKVVWFQNDGSMNFTQLVVDPVFENAYPIGVGDVNHDGHLDILAGNYIGNAFNWYRTDGGGTFTRFVLDNNSAGAHSIVTGDLDKDGDNDFVTASEDSDVVAWYENDGTAHFTLHVVDDFADQAKRAEIADIDGDGHLDIVAGNFLAREVVWYENDGQENFTKHLIFANQRGVYYVFPADVNGDQRIDVLAALERGSEITWYRNNANGTWTRFVIDDNSLNPRTVIGEDLDGDGDIDAIAASVTDNTLAWYENDGSGSFTKRFIDQTALGPYGVFTIDMDFDGDIDVLSANRDSHEVSLLTQIKAHTAAVNQGGTLLINAARLLTEDVDDGPAELTYTLISAPQRGTLKLSGSNLAAGGTFTQDDVNNGRVSYVHNGANTLADNFTFNVADGGESGVQPAGGTFTINVN